MSISAALVKELRQQTGSGMMDCKKALEAVDGNMEKAIEFLREKGLASAQKKASRIASEGLVDAYIHGGRIGVLIEVNSESDFVAKNSEFKEFVRNMAMQVAASNPKYISRAEVPAEEVEKERQILINQAMNENAAKGMDEAKSKMIAEKKVEGRLEKFFEQICLLDQSYIKDPDMKVDMVLKNFIAKIGENIRIRRFSRYEVGEGLEKKEENFADEVAKQMK